MLIPVDLHVHERTASGDSGTAVSVMAATARRRMGDFAMLGIVGHDQAPTEVPEDILSLVGVEYEIHTKPRRLHVIRFEEPSFTILAHPALTWPTNTREQAAEFIDANDIDAVEKWNSGHGGLQYQGNIEGVVELAGSDAHSGLMVGASYMLVDTETVSAPAVIQAIKNEEFHVVTTPVPWHRRLLGQVEKSLLLALSEPSSAVRTASERVGLRATRPH